LFGGATGYAYLKNCPGVISFSFCPLFYVVFSTFLVVGPGTGVTFGVACYYYLLNGVYGVLLSPLTPKMLHCDWGLQGIGEKTDGTLAFGLFRKLPGVSIILKIGLALI